MDSPFLLLVDPLALDWVRDQLAAIKETERINVGEVVSRINENTSVMACIEIDDFQPGTFRLDPRDILKFGRDEDGLDYEDVGGELAEPEDGSPSYPLVSVDSGALVAVDFAHLVQLAAFLSWERYDLTLRKGGDQVFEEITKDMGGPYFALIHACAGREMEFDGDGLYTLRPGCIRPAPD